jgi:cyclophilin family peptidyl-prolyl cis-trans isomerase
MLRFETSLGNFTVELNEKEAPITTKNFLRYVDEQHYDGTIFHRVIPGFMIQGGGMEPGMSEKDTHEPIKNEAKNGLKNERGTIAMARTNVVDSATAQFFINLKDNDFLNHKPGPASAFGYAVFGKVTEGMDVVDKIAKVKTGSRRGHQDVPVEDVVITSIRRVEAGK